ncbi:hypothetical protein [Hymenobacter algoricola]|uniref:Uncharacterized protein n=1 Tax=Hymenobacter algoricola TaxID=486267 RepID=A0ABP7N8Y3_9BACT
MFKNWPVWPFLLLCFLILTAMVVFVPEGTGRFLCAAVALVVFPIFPLVGGNFSFQKKGSSDKADENRLNNFALPVLLAIHLSFSVWWLVGVALVALWIWALTRKGEVGSYIPDVWPIVAVCLASIVTFAFALGAGVTYWLQ